MNAGGDIKELAINFLLYGALAEIFARTTGFNRGLGGSMHAFFIPFGIMPNNAIVGGGAPIALGLLSISAATIREESLLPTAATAHANAVLFLNPSTLRLWIRLLSFGMTATEPECRFSLTYSTTTMEWADKRGETMGYDMAARLGAGFNPDMMHLNA